VPYADASAGHTFTLEEQSHYIHVLITAARQELAVQRGEACMTYLFLASDFQNGQHSAELCRVLYDYFVFENTFDNALEVTDRLRDHAETDEEHLESAALQLRCLYQSNPTRAIAKLLDTARSYGNIDLEGDALILESRDVFRGTEPSPYLPDVTPTMAHAIMQGILNEAVAVTWSVSTGLAVSVVWHCIQIAQVSLVLYTPFHHQ
jgi:hypothetical protein